MARNQELVVITKTYDLILWSCNHTGKFPRNHRFVLGERIERNLYDLLEALIRAKYTRQRQPLLEQANLTLEILRFKCGSPRTCNVSRSKITVLRRRPLTRSGNSSVVGHGQRAATRHSHRQPDQPIFSQTSISTRYGA